MESKTLKSQLESARYKLENINNKRKITLEEILSMSGELDQLILNYHEVMMNRK